jgi:hypothetical protein
MRSWQLTLLALSNFSCLDTSPRPYEQFVPYQILMLGVEGLTAWTPQQLQQRWPSAVYVRPHSPLAVG